jgi:predicted RND superfamily exporter protein
MRLSRPVKFIVEATLLALAMTLVPIFLLVVLYFAGLTPPLNMLLWLGAALGWTTLVVYLYMKLFSKKGVVKAEK